MPQAGPKDTPDAKRIAAAIIRRKEIEKAFSDCGMRCEGFSWLLTELEWMQEGRDE